MSKDFEQYEVEDFAFDASFQHWVLAPEPQVNAFWEAFLQTHPEKTDQVLLARTLVLDLHQVENQPEDQVAAHQIWQKVQNTLQPQPRILWRNPGLWRAAAAVALLLGLFWGLRFWQSNLVGPSIAQRSQQQSESNYIQEVNHSSQALKIHLADGTLVTLAKNSRLSYPRKFKGAQRLVRLSGEAFFEVTKDPKKPFLVYANQTVTKVLGTSFRIKAYTEAPEVTIAVRTGRVSVFSEKEYHKQQFSTQLSGLILTPNQQATYNTQAQQLSKTLVEKPVVLQKPNTLTPFEFNETPLLQVFSTLENAYGVDIVFEPGDIATRSLTVSLENESLYEKLEVICKTLGLSYQIVDAQIIIANQTKPQ